MIHSHPAILKTWNNIIFHFYFLTRDHRYDSLDLAHSLFMVLILSFCWGRTPNGPMAFPLGPAGQPGVTGPPAAYGTASVWRTTRDRSRHYRCKHAKVWPELDRNRADAFQHRPDSGRVLVVYTSIIISYHLSCSRWPHMSWWVMDEAGDIYTREEVLSAGNQERT